MTDPPGFQPALGIDSVEWFAAGGNRLTVRVIGRWLRRPAAAHGQPMLVVTADGRRHRFPAIPEPPSLSGTAPGLWRTSFSVPAWLAPHLSRRLALQIGGVTIPLPGAVSVTQEAEPETGPEAGAVADRPPAELPSDEDIDAALDELAKAEARVRELEQETAELRRQAEEVEQGTAEAEQPAPSPPGRPLHWVAEPLRQEADIAHGATRPSSTPSRAEPSEPRGLRRELEMRAARARHPPGESRLASMEKALEEARRELAARTEAEASVRAALASVQRNLDARIASQSLLEQTLEEERGRSASLARRISELESQLSGAAAAREAAEAEARRLELELTNARAELDQARVVSHRDTAALAEAEALLARAHQLAHDAQEQLSGARERVRRAEAQRDQLEREFAAYRARSARVHDAIDELRRQLAAMRASHSTAAPEPAVTAQPPPPRPSAPPNLRPSEPVPEVEPERLTEALSRLRDATPETEPGPEPISEPAVAKPEPDAEPQPTAEREPETTPVGPWLGGVVRRLAADEPATAARLLIGLLPAQRLVDQRSMSYDLLLADHGTVRVTVADTGVVVEHGGEPREQRETDFRVVGDLAGLGRLVTARALRRRFGRAMARVKGDRGAARALFALADAKLGLRELDAGGVRLDPPLALTVVSMLVDPAWTEGERFTVAFVTPGTEVRTNYLHVRDGQPLFVGDEAPLGPVATTVVCPADALLGVLSGAWPDEVGVHGDEHPLELLLEWIKRAQSG